jgi:predicted dehydrogenase
MDRREGRDGRELRVGLVGAGGIAQSYLRVFEALEGARVTAVADVRGRAADALAETVRGTAYPSHRALLEDADVDAVLVCTPPSTHAEIVLQSIERGRHVMCEKPLAIDVSSARAMVDAADAAGVVFTMAAKFRFVEDVIRARQIVASGILGELIVLENLFASRIDMSRRWNSDPDVSGGGVIIDNGTHSVDIVRYFLGPVVDVMAVEANRVQHLPVEDTATMLLRTAGGVLASVDLSWSVDKATDAYLTLYGSQGTISVGWSGARYRQVGSPDFVEFGEGYDKIACMSRQMENFCAAIRGDEELAITAEDAIASVAVIEAAYTALGRDDWIAVRDVTGGDGATGEQVA